MARRARLFGCASCLTIPHRCNGATVRNREIEKCKISLFGSGKAGLEIMTQVLTGLAEGLGLIKSPDCVRLRCCNRAQSGETGR